MSQRTSGVILTAAKADITICEVFGDIPTGLIPVNGKPIIFFILQQMYANNIKNVYIGVDYKSEILIEIVNLYFSKKLNINYIFTDKSKAPGNSLLTILKEIEYGKVIINLADTYIKGFDFKNSSDTIVVSNDFLDEERWATVKVSNEQIVEFINKKKHDNDNIYAICGVYCLSNIESLINFNKMKDNLQVTDLLEYYVQKMAKLKIIKTKEWLDFGHIDKYYISKKKLIQSRDFNSLEYDDLLGTITKRSKNRDKFRAEITWQITLPKDIQVLAPRVLDYSLDANPYIKMEFYSYPTLSEIWLFSDLNEKVYFSIIDKMFRILELFLKNKKKIEWTSYQNIYIDKTINRVDSITNETILGLLAMDKLKINGQILNNWKLIDKKVFSLVNNLYNENDNCFIHGDFCMSNILYDLRSGIVRLIDPRGIWGETENGDIKYDIAKLRHSLCNDYDYIVNDLFTVDVAVENIKYKIFNSKKDRVKEYFDYKLSTLYDLKQIKLIEGLLFLSMVPLHDDSSERQIVMYLKAMILLNDAIREKV